MSAAAHNPQEEILPQFAQVAVPLHLNQTFTYRLPLALQRDARVGSRLLVPFGSKPITGYIVGLLRQLEPDISLAESEIKNATALLDAEPLITAEVLEITRWVADYYAAPWGEVLKAALPAGINASVEQIVSLTDAGRKELTTLIGDAPTKSKSKGLQLLAEEGDFDIKTFCLRLSLASVPQWLRELERDSSAAAAPQHWA